MPCAFTVEDVRSQQRRTLVSLGRYRRLSDYVSSALLYLRRNVLLRAVLEADDLRETPAGPWHGVPAMGVLYAHLNRLHRDHDEGMRFITAAPAAPIAHLANLWLEGGTVADYGVAGAGLNAIVERLDEALKTYAREVRNCATADAALAEGILALDDFTGTVMCALDLGLAEKRFLDGAVELLRTPSAALIPILLMQGRLGATPGYASMDDPERTAYLQEMGYAVRTVEIGLQFEARLFTTLEWGWHAARGEAVPGAEDSGHPVIVLKVPRALTMPPALSSLLDREPERFLDLVRADASLMDPFRTWIEGYLPGELVEADGVPDKDILALCAAPEQRLARSR